VSERGSYTTEYIYCSECFKAVSSILRAEGQSKWLTSHQAFYWRGNFMETLPILSGKVGGTYSREEVDTLEELACRMAAEVCHPVRIVVIPDAGDPVLIVAEPGAVAVHGAEVLQ
jgi:hypothetical protein